MPFRLFFPSAPEGARATTAPVIAGRSRLAPPGTAHKRLPAGRATAAGPAVASSPANDLGNFALPGNFAVRGNKARVARAEVPRNAEFPRYGHRVHRGAPGEPGIRDGPKAATAPTLAKTLAKRHWLIHGEQDLSGSKPAFAAVSVPDVIAPACP